MQNRNTKFLFSCFFIFMTFYASAAHWMTYYVYHETHYEQGPWVRQDLLYESGFKYLVAKQHQDLFGTENTQMIEKMISRLQDEKPELYDWDYDVKIENDTVFIVPQRNTEASETIKNEISATLGMNGFDPIVFGAGDQKNIWRLQDISLPLLDLVTLSDDDNQSVKPEIENQPDDTLSIKPLEKELFETSKTDKNSFPLLLIVSILLNITLLILLFRKKSS